MHAYQGMKINGKNQESNEMKKYLFYFYYFPLAPCAHFVT